MYDFVAKASHKYSLEGLNVDWVSVLQVGTIFFFWNKGCLPFTGKNQLIDS